MLTFGHLSIPGLRVGVVFELPFLGVISSYYRLNLLRIMKAHDKKARIKFYGLQV
jgi:hypothetical protein